MLAAGQGYAACAFQHAGGSRFRRSQKAREGLLHKGKASVAALLRINVSKSTKTLAIGPLIFKKQITQTGLSE